VFQDDVLLLPLTVQVNICTDAS